MSLTSLAVANHVFDIPGRSMQTFVPSCHRLFFGCICGHLSWLDMGTAFVWLSRKWRRRWSLSTCGLGDTGIRFVTEALHRPVPDPRNDTRQLLVDKLELYILMVEIQSGCVK